MKWNRRGNLFKVRNADPFVIKAAKIFFFVDFALVLVFMATLDMWAMRVTDQIYSFKIVMRTANVYYVPNILGIAYWTGMVLLPLTFFFVLSYMFWPLNQKETKLNGLNEQEDKIDIVLKHYFQSKNLVDANKTMEDCKRKFKKVYGYGIFSQMWHRVSISIVKTSRGDLESLKNAANLSLTDWRDALVIAGFANSIESHKEWEDKIIAVSLNKNRSQSAREEKEE